MSLAIQENRSLSLIERLPVEIIGEIRSFLSRRDVKSLSATNRHFYYMINEKEFSKTDSFVRFLIENLHGNVLRNKLINSLEGDEASKMGYKYQVIQMAQTLSMEVLFDLKDIAKRNQEIDIIELLDTITLYIKSREKTKEIGLIELLTNALFCKENNSVSTHSSESKLFLIANLLCTGQKINSCRATP